MPEEERRWLEAALRSAMVDLGKRMQDIKVGLEGGDDLEEGVGSAEGELQGASAAAVEGAAEGEPGTAAAAAAAAAASLAAKERLLDELMELVESIDLARGAQWWWGRGGGPGWGPGGGGLPRRPVGSRALSPGHLMAPHTHPRSSTPRPPARLQTCTPSAACRRCWACWAAPTPRCAGAPPRSPPPAPRTTPTCRRRSWRAASCPACCRCCSPAAASATCG